MKTRLSPRRVRRAMLCGAIAAAAALAWMGREDAASAQHAKADAAAEAGADAGSADASARRIPPDPPALSERFQWVFDLRWERGDVYLVQVHKIDMGSSHPTPRVMGRFALELYEGPTLIERARFDFPMLGAPEISDGGWRAPARFEPKLKTRIGVIFPATKRGTRLELWDRALDKRWPLPWPPTEGTYGDGPDAGSAASRDRVADAGSAARDR